MKYILGTKQNMVQLFDDNGVATPATLVSAGPVVVTQVKTQDKDGYTAVQVGFGSRKPKNVTKAIKGHVKELGSFSNLKEFRLEGVEGLEVGKTIDASVFNEGDVVRVSAISKGKGFQGVVKRYNFKGGPRSHGQKHSEREPGSISGGTREGGRVPKGMRMAGRTGSDRVTITNLKVLKVDKENNALFLSGALPGRRGTLVEIISK